MDLVVGARTIGDVGLVVFDKDGTLIELYHYWSQMVALRARLIARALSLDGRREADLVEALGVDAAAGRLKPQGPVGLRKREVVIQAAVDCLKGAGGEDARRICTEAFARADELSGADLARFVKPIPGAVGLIAALSAAGCRVAVATVDRSDRARLALDFLGLSRRVDLVVGGEQVGRAKPDPEMLELILAELGVERSRAVMVGDALTDLAMGRDAGFKATVGVLTGFATRAEVKQLTPYVARDLSELAVG
jgi:phosphoglycolate phosphatase